MIDRKKVLRGLEWYMRTLKAKECRFALVDCPYVEACRSTSSENKLFEDIYTLLKEQDSVIDSIRNKRCPNCNTILKGRFCHECGQAVKWDD